MNAPLVEARPPSTDAERCNRRRWDGTRLCSMRGDLLLTAVCVHEHLSESRYCEVHATYALAAKLCCVACRESSEPHFCKVRVIASEPVAA